MDASATQSLPPVPEIEPIPLIDQGRRGAVVLLDAAPGRAAALREIGERHYSRLGLRLGDAVGRAWLRRNDNPYRDEIEAVAARLGGPGGVALNLSYEYACTGLVGPDPTGSGMRLLRVLDWRLDGLGRNVVVAQVQAPAGDYHNVTWPGAVGVLTAMAPGRFAAAIHQAPLRTHSLTTLGDWAVNRARVWCSRGLPPAHLLRHVFEHCRDYPSARQQLAETPVAIPAIFLLAGVAPGECCIIERVEDEAAIHDGAGIWANDWRTTGFAGNWHARGADNPGRCAGLAALADQPSDGFAWLRPPVLHRDTRLAVRANAATAELAVLGIEAERPATQEFIFRNKGLNAA